MERRKLRDKPPEGGAYLDMVAPPSFLKSGCTLLDCVLGGGYAMNRIINIVGDKSTGKTLLAIEAFANFLRKYPEGRVYYAESEAAFDSHYAESLGISLRDIIYYKCSTMQLLIAHLKKVCSVKHPHPRMYVIDSLDGLTTDEELERDIKDGTYNVDKAKHLNKLFRLLTVELNTENITFIIISQIRDKIGAMFGDKHTRAGEKPLNFYCSQVIWLNHLKQITTTRRGVKRVTGVVIQAKCKKNKVGPPFRDCTFPIEFGYGINDAEACLNYLEEVGIDTSEIDSPKQIRARLKDDEEHAKLCKQLARLTRRAWAEVEDDFKVTRKKYQ